jgi:hypothetical protein
MRYNEIISENQTSDNIEQAAWWLTRWISGSMNDPDWDDSWTTFGIDRAFEILHQVVGNKYSMTKPVLWRYIAVKKSLAKKIIANKILPVSPNSVFQSFTGGREIAEAEGPEIVGHIPPSYCALLISIHPDPSMVMFGMADLQNSRDPAVQDALMQLDIWHHQDEVIVRIDAPLALVSAEIL